MNGAIITAKNEEATIGALVAKLVSMGLDVVVVDDGSTDSTGKEAITAGATVIRHEASRGIGKSLMEAWKYALEVGWDYTVQIDAGGSHNPTDANSFLKSIDKLAGVGITKDLVVGTRFRSDSEYIGRRWRAAASSFVAGLLNWTTHKKISDWTSGYRVFSRMALQELSKPLYITNMHTWQIEVLFEAVRRGLTIAEFPITYRAGDSTMKFSTVSDLVKVYLWIFNG
jgi:hypothetical protein